MDRDDIARVIAASNRHGVFLHQAVVEVFKRGGGSAFKFNGISVEHPIANPKSGPADLIVRGFIQNDIVGAIPLTLAIECKRAYGEKRKLFFLPAGGNPNEFRSQKMRLFRGLPSDFKILRNPKARTVWAPYQFGRPSFADVPVASAGTWVDFHDQDPKKDRAGVALYEAANQACGAMVGIMKEDFAGGPYRGEQRTIMNYLPVIVTNSQLYLVQGLDAIDLETGNADPQSSDFKEVPMLFYRHPYPVAEGTGDPRGHAEESTPEWRRSSMFKETILVIKATELASLFSNHSLATEIAVAYESHQD